MGVMHTINWQEQRVEGKGGGGGGGLVIPPWGTVTAGG